MNPKIPGSKNSNPKNPYQQLDLRCNPFTQKRQEELPDSTWIDRGLSAPPDVERPAFVQIQGPRGAGKSSHLKHWKQKIGGQYVHYSKSGFNLQFPPIGENVYWDEAQRIPKLILYVSLLMIKLRGGRVFATTHAGLSHWARWTGLNVRTISLPRPGVDECLNWARKRIQWATQDGEEPSLSLDRSLMEAFHAEAEGDFCKLADRLHVWVSRKIDS
ncbi:MAG: hypothetical protein ABEJ65_11360 [bacterium]